MWKAVAYAFLVTHQDVQGKMRSVIFDLGSPKDMVNDLPPALAKAIQDLDGYMKVDKHVSEILTENNVSLESIEVLIWR